MKLEHTFLTKAHDIRALYTETKTLKEFCKKLEGQSLKDPIRYPSEKYLGDGFESFIEILLALHPTDNRLGVYDYHPNLTNDNGVVAPCVIYSSPKKPHKIFNMVSSPESPSRPTKSTSLQDYKSTSLKDLGGGTKESFRPQTEGRQSLPPGSKT